ncbi:MAG: peroxide stress protein YaaA [Chloroflexi bacterium]|nr:peroxide stress protein YaaA [Chloroflexota bacterium]MBT5253563.1 peroxide stress protein YaaA [Chloroflexota bacterium]MBT5477280.1 peroxide stress protein YaaA [Chloroflexota bacterium]MBT7079139.1 peroxide stress protein YaaA [Chloroflexota bacterium]
MSNTLLILLPPSEGKSSGGHGPSIDLPSLSFDQLNPTRLLMMKALVQLSGKPQVAQKMLGVKGSALEKARTDNAAVSSSPTALAIERYTGVMYDSINHVSLDDSAKKVFGESTIIMSGLFGVLRPFDFIPAYKLKMSAKLRRNMACSTIWQPLVTKVLTPIAEDRVIWDLLPREHMAAWEPSKVKIRNRFTVKFLEANVDGQLRTVNHWSKLLKGALIRHLVSNPEAAGSTELAPELLANFSHPEGYEYRPDISTEIEGVTEITFVKNTISQ